MQLFLHQIPSATHHSFTGITNSPDHSAYTQFTRMTPTALLTDNTVAACTIPCCSALHL